jgi:bacterioferritin
MNPEELIERLNWFYSLEMNQVEWYKAQSVLFRKKYAGRVFERVSEIEQNHVDNIAQEIYRLGGKPTYLGEVISPILGFSLGNLVSLTGLENVLEINKKVEIKAMSDYRRLLMELLKNGEEPQKELCKRLEANYIDEHLHTAFFDTLRDHLKEEKMELQIRNE